MFRSRAKCGPIAVDIGANGVKLLQLRDSSGGLCVHAAHFEAIPFDVEDPAERIAATEQAIADAVRRQPFQGRDVVSALGIGEFQIKNIRLPSMPADELVSAVEFEANDRFSFGEKEVELRHLSVGQVRHGNEFKDEIIVCAATDELIRSRLAVFKNLKLRPIAIDLSPCAVARGFVRFMRRAEDAQAVNVFLDIGWRGSSIVVVRGTDISFLKMVEVGGKHFNAAVAKTLGVSPDDATDLRVRIMREECGRRAADKTGVTTELKSTVSDAVRPLVERLSRDIQLCLRYYAVTFRGQRPESLTFVGGEAYDPTLMQVIERAIDVPCTIGNPLRGVGEIEALGGPDQMTYRPAWAVACGLSLRGSRWVQANPASMETTADIGSARSPEAAHSPESARSPETVGAGGAKL